MANLPRLFFNGTMLDNSKSHNHLVVTFNSNGKWWDHRRINILRLMKHKLYIGFNRPILEYGGIVWDNPELKNTGIWFTGKCTTRGSSHNYRIKKGNVTQKLYTELGWVPLKERRRTNKIILLHKILYDETPEYLLNEILLHANQQSSNDLRSNRVFEPSLCNNTSYKCSCFPNVIDSWNLLDVDMQNQHSRLMFKKQIRSNISVPPPYFALGTRKYNIFHCQLRN